MIIDTVQTFLKLFPSSRGQRRPKKGQKLQKDKVQGCQSTETSLLIEIMQLQCWNVINIWYSLVAYDYNTVQAPSKIIPCLQSIQKVKKGQKNQVQGGQKYRNEYIDWNNAITVLKLHEYLELVGSL